MNHLTRLAFFADGPSAPVGTARNAEELSKDPGLAPGLHRTEGAGEVIAQASPADRSSQFVAVTGAEAEQSNANNLVIAAYGLFWVFTFILVWVTFRAQGRLKARMQELERRLPKDSTSP